MADITYTRDYFRAQVAELTHRLGTKSFWQNPDAPFIAAHAISKVYLHTEDGEEDADIYAFAIREIAMRHSYVMLLQTRRDQ
jgi:hypothetical protein